MSSDVKYIEKQGFLHKMGFENPSWKKRWFVLAKNEIIYYGKDKDAKIQKNEKGRFTLDFLSKTKIKAVETGSILVNSNALSARNTKVTLKRPFLIEIGNCKWKDTDLRTFYVSCENAAEREEWIRAFQHNCDTYLTTSEGKADIEKIPPEGPRREAYRLWEEENKRMEEKAKMEAEAAERQARQKAMREEPWYQVHTLCSKGTLEELKEAVEKQSIDIKLRNPNGGSTLLQAATYGNLEIMRYLVDQGLDINGASNGGNTALHAAACMGFFDAAKLLLERGADRTKVNREGKTAAQSAKTAEIRDLIENWGETSAST